MLRKLKKLWFTDAATTFDRRISRVEKFIVFQKFNSKLKRGKAEVEGSPTTIIEALKVTLIF